MRSLRIGALLLVLALLVTGVGASSAGAAERTGRWLVVLEDGRSARASSVSALVARAGARTAGRGVPRLGIATVDGSPRALDALRRDPAVEAVAPEYSRDFRLSPNDPAFGRQQAGLPAGVPIQWPLARQGFPAAWDVTRGAGAIVGVLDSGLDGSHPELGPKVAASAEYGTATGPLTDQDGHGSHVSGLACAGTNNGTGVSGAGWDCNIVMAKTQLLRDEDIANGIAFAVGHGAQAINMSFGSGPQSPALDQAFDFAVARGVVLVAAASNAPASDQGSPASQLQPGDAADIAKGRGLVVTAADFFDTRAGTGFGPQISMAAYGYYDEVEGPPGLFSTYTSLTTPQNQFCGCRTTLDGDARYAYLQGTSMAAPQVAAAAALVGRLNPALTAAEKIRILKETARRSGGWTPDLGWGILDAGAAVDAARRIDRVAPVSSVRGRRRVRMKRGRARRSRVEARLRLRLVGDDPAGGEGLLPSGLRGFDVYAKRGRGAPRLVKRGLRSRTTTVRLRRSGRYGFYSVAVDAAGNGEAAPDRADRVVRVLGPRR